MGGAGRSERRGKGSPERARVVMTKCNERMLELSVENAQRWELRAAQVAEAGCGALSLLAEHPPTLDYFRRVGQEGHEYPQDAEYMVAYLWDFVIRLEANQRAFARRGRAELYLVAQMIDAAASARRRLKYRVQPWVEQWPLDEILVRLSKDVCFISDVLGRLHPQEVADEQHRVLAPKIRRAAAVVTWVAVSLALINDATDLTERFGDEAVVSGSYLMREAAEEAHHEAEILREAWTVELEREMAANRDALEMRDWEEDEEL